MTAMQYNHLRSSIMDNYGIKPIDSAIEELISIGFISLTSSGDFALTNEGYNYMINQ